MNSRLLRAEALDVRNGEAFKARPTERAAGIPLDELRHRPYELPPANVTVTIADTGPEATEAASVLTQMGRNPQLVPARSVEATGDRYRLWRVTSLLEVAQTASPCRALCLACGVGREAVVLAAAGWKVVAIDVLPDAIDRGRRLEKAYLPAGAPSIQWLVADLRKPLPDDFGDFELITQFFFSDSATAERVTQRLLPGGVALIESFSEHHWRALGRSKPDRILRAQEWNPAFDVSQAEGLHEGRHTTRLIVRKT